MRRCVAGYQVTVTVRMPSSEGPTPEQAAAREASLRYVDDGSPGFGRKRRGSSFSYVDTAGRVIRDPSQLGRIKALAIPPAYETVWICPLPNGHLQATGRDARGRKQYRYHKRWREVRDEAKFEHAIAFARGLPALRAHVARDLSSATLTKETVVAVVVKLLDTTLARVGNEVYAKENGSFGLTTLRSRHVERGTSGLRLRFKGKSGVEHKIRVTDRRLASVIRRCNDLPGQWLFGYVDDAGSVVPVSSDDVNAYVRDAIGADFTAKDFRTWHGTVLCAQELDAAEAAETPRDRQSAIATALKAVAARLRNTPAVCRSSYVHPSLIERYLDAGNLTLPKAARSRASAIALAPEESRVLRFLERAAKARR